MSEIKIPFNCFVDQDGYVLPKSAIIPSSTEVKQWILEHPFIVPFDGTDKFLNTTEPFIMVTIGHSIVGNIYHTAWNKSERVAKMENDTYTKWFYDFEAFKKYLMWTHKLGKKFTRQLKNK